MTAKRICTACQGTGAGGRDSEGTTTPCEVCGGAGHFLVRRDPPLFREVLIMSTPQKEFRHV